MMVSVLGYLRDVIIYAQFGQNRLPMPIMPLFLSLIFIYALVAGPQALLLSCIFQLYRYGKGKEGWEVASIVLTVIMALLVVELLSDIFMRQN